jgi:hypothetical protein
MSNLFWILVVVGGPIILGAAIAFALISRRPLTPIEEEKREDAIKDMYQKPH